MDFNLKNLNQFQQLTTLDMHTEGEPLRIVTSGYPQIIGDTILEKRRFVERELDHLRKALMFEPRGHADMYGALITEPCTEDGDFGILFMHNEGYSSMCGHGIIATVTAAIECNDIQVYENDVATINIDSPAGRIVAYGQLVEGKPQVSFDCVSSFVEVTDQQVTIEGLGKVDYDIAFGGAYYAYVDADKLGLSCDPNNVENLIHFGRAIKKAVIADYQLHHPEHDDLSFLYGTIFTSNKVTNPTSHSRHVCIFADGEVDRSPTGTGVSGRIALLMHKENIAINEAVTIESILSTSMTVYGHKPHEYFNKQAVIPNVSGSAFVTGQHRFYIDKTDPVNPGFILR